MTEQTSGIQPRPHQPVPWPRVLAFVLALGIGAALPAQPFPSFLLDTTRYIGRDLRIAGSYVALAASPSRGVVVWGGSGVNCCRASRLTRTMDVIDTIPLDATGPWDDLLSAPAAACSDSGCAIAWDGYGGLCLALVSQTGDGINRVPVDTVVQVHSMAAAAGTDRYVAVYDGWFSSSQTLDVRAAEVALNGAILRRTVVARGQSAAPFVGASAVAHGDSAYFAVFEGPYSDTTNISGRFVWPQNCTADTAIIPIRRGCHAFGPSVAFDGDNFWVAWIEETTPSAETVAKVARVTQSGLVLDTAGIVVGSGVRSVALAAARETALVALHLDGDLIVAMRYDAAAQLVDSTPLLLSTQAVSGLTAAVSADTFLVVWRDRVVGVSEGGERLAGRRIVSSGGVIDPGVRDYAFSANNHDNDYVVDAAIASDGENFLAVWSDERAEPDYTARLLGRRFDNQGLFLDAKPFTINNPSSGPLRPVLTYGLGYYFVTWSDGGSAASFAARISPQGVVMDTVPIALPSSTGFSAFDVAFLRDSVFVVLGGDTLTNLPEVVRVMSDGRVLDSLPRVIKVRWHPRWHNSYPSLASVGDTLVLACRLDSANFLLNSWLGVGLYDRALNQYDSIWWRPKPDYLFAWRTSVVCGGGRILVASDPRLRSRKPDLWLLDSVGHVLRDSLSLPNPYPYGNNFCLGYDGVNFMCAKSGEGFTSLPGYRVSRDGDLLDNPVVYLVELESTLVTGHCGLASDTLGHVGLVFFTFESRGYMSDRIRAAVFLRMTGGIESPCSADNLGMLMINPNPSTGVVWLDLAGSFGKPQTITVRDIAGRVRTEVSLSPAPADRVRTMLNLRGLPAGVYFLETAGERGRCKLVLARPGGAP
jgi:hypothetical protein